MLLWFAGRMFETLLSDGLAWQASRLLLLESLRVSKLFAFRMLLKSVRWNICPSLFPPHKCPVRVSLSKALGRGNKRSETPAKTAVKRRFEFDDESVALPKGRGVYFDDPSFATALRAEDKTVSSRRSGRSSRAAPMFQSSPQ